MARQKQKKWRVYFDLNAPREDRRRKRRPGRELPIHQTFSWGGTEWRIPAVYVCAQGLVADFVRRVPAGSIQTFTGRWKLRPDEDRYDFTREERMQLDSENPLTFDFSPTLLLNGRPLHSSDGRGTCWNPLPGCHDPDDLLLLKHYGLDPADGWVFWRYNFPWKTKHKPPIRSLAVYMEAARVSLPGPHITVQREGDSFPFTGPDGIAHTLTVRKNEKAAAFFAAALLIVADFPAGWCQSRRRWPDSRPGPPADSRRRRRKALHRRRWSQSTALPAPPGKWTVRAG